MVYKETTVGAGKDFLHPLQESNLDQPTHLQKFALKANHRSTSNMFKSAVIALAAIASVASASPVDNKQPAKKDSQWGTGTFYYQNGNPGNCGWYMG